MGYRYAAPFDMVLQHTAICLGIIVTVGFVLTKFFDVLMAAPLSQANQDAGYLGGILSMSVVFFGNMPCRLVVRRNGFIGRQLDNLIDHNLTTEPRSGFRFGCIVKEIGNGDVVYIPRYNPLIPRKFQFGANGDGWVLKIFSCQSCIFVRTSEETVTITAPYRSMRLLAPRLKQHA